MPIDHYENFPVASVLLPARLRPAVEAIYAFARSADDLADEGQATPAERIAALEAYESELERIEDGAQPGSEMFLSLAEMVNRYSIPLQPLRDLLSAFKQDISTTRYQTFASLMDYCRRSADPVGRIMLHLYGESSVRNLRDSDAICSALQLINFCQDIAVDWKKDRIYLPQEDLQRFDVGIHHLENARVDDAWRELMRFEIARARAMILSGAPLALRIRGRIGWELRLVVQGGLRVLECIEAVDYDVFRRRPQLGPADWARMVIRALRMKQ
jgi:squalene synthase HpnC